MEVKEMAHDQLNQTYVVDKLPAFTNYTFYVRSYNSNAASDNSAEVVCRTGESGQYTIQYVKSNNIYTRKHMLTFHSFFPFVWN